MSLESIVIPNYSRKEESFNALSHILGILVSLATLIISIVALAKGEITLFHFFGLLVFVLTSAAVYIISATYHYLDKDNHLKKLFRVLDHCTIYLLIAGTYTPICFVLMNEHVVGLIMLIIEWVGAIIGIILNGFFFNYKAARIVSFILYVAMGWLAVYSTGFLYMPKMCFLFILLGGIVYTIGSILYALGHKNTKFHCIFHVFVLTATIIQAIGLIYLFI